MSGEAKPEGTTEEQKVEHINLRVLGSDGGEIAFKIKRNTPLQKLMDAYCKKTGIDSKTVRFLFDGERLKGDDTADSLDLQDDDQIQTFSDQIGGCQ